MDTGALPRRLGHIRWGNLLVAGIALVAWGLFLRAQLAALRGYDVRITPLAYGLALSLAVIYFVGLASCWALLLRHMGSREEAMSIPNATRIWFYSMITRYIPGNVWHVVSRVALARKYGVPAALIVSSATIEQVLTLLSALVCVSLSAPFSGAIRGSQSWLLLIVPLGLALLHPSVLGVVLRRASVTLQRPGLAWQYSYFQIVSFIIAYCLCWLCSGLALFALLWGLVPVTIAQLPLVIGAATLAWVVGFLSFFTPSGLGVREAVLVAALSTVYPLPTALVASLLHRVALTLAEMLVFLVVRIIGGQGADAGGGHSHSGA